MNLQAELERALIEYNEAYRQGEPLISDAEYDELMDTLKSMYPDSTLLNKAVIEAPKGSRKQKLPIPMFSLEKKKTIEELIKWGDSVGLSSEDKIVITPKYDGISLCVQELDGDCYTRGDGEVGQKSNEHLLYISQPTRQDFISFGEAIIPKDFFENHWAEKYATARNLVAGLFNRDEASSDLLGVKYVRYGTNLKINKSKQLEKLKKELSGMSSTDYFVTEYKMIKVDGFANVLNKLYRTWGDEFALDGLVIDIDSYEKRESLGRLDNGNPSYAVAYKSPEWNIKYRSVVTGIEKNVSKQGKIKPVILIDPVDIDGVIVSRVTGYNAKYLIDNNIAEDSEIEIVRSGEVIPKHIKTLSFCPNSVEQMIDDYMVCPSCGEPCKWGETMTEIVCVNSECEDMKISKLEHFFDTVGVEEFRRPSIEFLYNKGYKTVKDIISIDHEALSSFEGWGDSSAATVIDQFKKLVNQGVSYARLLHAIDVFNGSIGEKTIQLILDNYDVMMITSAKPNDLVFIKGVENKTAATFINGFSKALSIIRELPIKVTNIRSAVKEIKGDSCVGMKVCFTGVRSKELEDYIKENGGEVVSGISKSTTHLIVKDMSEATLASSKSKKAKELNIEIQTINQFKTI